MVDGVDSFGQHRRIAATFFESYILVVQHAGPTVAAAGGILAGTFGVLVLSPMSFLAQIGFGVAIGILLSAFVMSAFLVPGITAMLGHRAWWPGHGDAAAAHPGQEPQPISTAVH